VKEQMLKAFDDWIRLAENGRMPAYWAMIAFSAGWKASQLNNSTIPVD